MLYNLFMLYSLYMLYSYAKPFCASSNDLEHGAGLMIGGSGSLFDVKPLCFDVASDGSVLSVF